MSKRKKPITVFDLDPRRPVSLTARQRAELEELAEMRDDQIDYGDVPPLDARMLQRAVRAGMYRPRKQQLTLRVDRDVIAWQRSKGNGYQSRINSILRQAMVKEIRSRG